MPALSAASFTTRHSVRRPARPGRPPVMRPPLPYRALSLAALSALLEARGAAA